MGWPYHFVDLTEEQKIDRRHALDWYATVAQLSVLLPLLGVQYCFLVRWVVRRWRANGGGQREPPSSPLGKRARSGVVARLEGKARKVAWWAGEEVRFLGERMGNRGEVIGALAWMGWLVVLCTVQTGDDYLHFTKRFGIVAASQMPCHYLLALKSPYSPLQLLTRSSHETINSLHQLLGKIIVILLYGHAILYLNFYIMSNLLVAKLQEAYVLCGVFGIIAFTIIGTSAMGFVRRWSYRVFYTVHVLLATAILPVLYFHCSHIRPYLYQTAGIYAVNAVLRMFALQRMAGTVITVPGTNLVEISIPIPPDKKHQAGRWQPGHHAYLSLPGYRFLTTFRSNPFTVASLPSIDSELKFVARVLDGNTRKLAQNSTRDGAGKATRHITIEGPYGLSSHSKDLLVYDRVLLIAGGVGATFTVPIYRQLLADLSPSKGSYRRQKVSFVWIARSKADVTWALPENSVERDGFVERLKVCLTGDAMAGDGVRTTTDSSFAIGDDEDDGNGGALGEAEDGIELEEQKQLLPDSADAEGEKEHAGSLAISAGRPDVGRLVDQAFAHGVSERVAVLVCGPRSLNQAVRRQVGKWVTKGRDVWFWEEKFAF